MADVIEREASKWVWDPDGMDWNIGSWKCGKCHARPGTWWQGWERINPLLCEGSHYCGNCGAKMDGGKKDVG